MSAQAKTPAMLASRRSSRAESARHHSCGRPGHQLRPPSQTRSKAWHRLAISANLVDLSSWGVFGSGNPGPDADGCRRANYHRTDCVRWELDTGNVDDEFANELAFPNLVPGDDHGFAPFSLIILPIGQYSACNSVPDPIPMLRIRVSAYSHDGTPGNLNRLRMGFYDDDNVSLAQSSEVGPSVADTSTWVTSDVFKFGKNNTPIPKSAICSPTACDNHTIPCATGARYQFGVAPVLDDFPTYDAA